MSKDIISKKTRGEFREYFVGWTLREIEMEFDAADVLIDEDYKPPCTGARRSLVEKYYHTVDWSRWSDVRKVLTVYENVLARLEEQADSDLPFIDSDVVKNQFRMLCKWIEKDGFKYQEGKIISIGKTIALKEIADTSIALDVPELHRQIDRLQDAVEDDPGLAIGTAKELVETTCKTILEDRGISYDENEDIAKLIKKTRKVLGLVPDSVPQSAKGAETIRRLLSNLGNITQGLGELRNLYGTGHGKSGKTRGLSARHARLAVGAASTLAVFLFETHEERNI